MNSIYKKFNQQTEINTLYTDAFSRLRVSEPYTLFDSTNKYALSNLFFSNTTNGGYVTNIVPESTANLITHTNPSSVIRQSKYSFPYQPGKSLYILCSFCFSDTDSIQRIGYFDDDNGIFLELSNQTIYICKRNNGVDQKIPQSSWENPMRNLNLYNIQIFFMDFEWLGSGSVRVGFFIDGVPITCHSFHHANYTNSVYIKTACLPVRASIQNINVLTSNAWMKSICSTIFSEGGYEPKNSMLFIKHVGLTPTTTIPIGNGIPTPIISLRLKTGYYNMCVYIKKILILLSTNNDIAYWYIILNPILSGTVWSPHDTSYAVEVDTSSISYTNGRIISSGLFSTQASIEKDISNAIQIGLTNTNTSDVVTLAVASLSGTNSKVSAQVGWFEI